VKHDFSMNIGSSSLEKLLGPSKYAYKEFLVEGLRVVEVDVDGEPEVVHLWIELDQRRIGCASSGSKVRVDLSSWWPQGRRHLRIKLDRHLGEENVLTSRSVPYAVNVTASIEATSVTELRSDM